MTPRPLLIVVLAAGQGTRMQSALPKVLHKVGGRSMLAHVLAAAQELAAQSVAVVVGPDMEAVRGEALNEIASAHVCLQPERNGTADALLAASEALARHSGDVLVLYGDTPLLTVPTLERVLAALDNGAGIAILGFEAGDPTGYGRLMCEGPWLKAIREEKDASPEERRLTLCNSGVMAFRLDDLVGVLGRIDNKNAKGEFYLTDIVGVAGGDGARATVVVCEEDEVMGVNSREQLAAAEAVFQKRMRRAAMRAGATLIAPETVWFAWDTRIGRDVVIEPNVFFGPGVVIEDGAEIKANSHMERARVGPGARIGPFARLRPGADVGANARVGNFVELKNVRLRDGAKANHLAYLGDGDVGAGSNIGAGTIFCNYDGFLKHFTEIGDKVFIGSNSSLVAPVKIGEGAYIGSGSVITKSVSAGALALTRPEQVERPGWAAKFRTMMARRKAEKK
ncbi:MAG TPA: bifunctional UDP-N-acetylglucosamine diphosphorylase/glucosamine-1-phosphate N-acetyltransferase GlmU [Hyphomicrobium sp.]